MTQEIKKESSEGAFARAYELVIQHYLWLDIQIHTFTRFAHFAHLNRETRFLVFMAFYNIQRSKPIHIELCVGSIGLVYIFKQIIKFWQIIRIHFKLNNQLQLNQTTQTTQLNNTNLDFSRIVSDCIHASMKFPYVP